MFKYCSKVVLLLSLILQGPVAFALPPQIKAVNEFMANKLQRRASIKGFASIDINGAFHICFTGIEYFRANPFKYTSFNVDGSIKVNEKTLLSCSNISCFSKYRAISDNRGLLHVIFDDRRAKSYGNYTYILIDGSGNIMKEIDLGRLIIFSDMNILPDGSLIINGHKTDPITLSQFEIFYIFQRESNEYQLIEIKRPISSWDTPNFASSLFSINDSLLLLFSTHYNYETGDWNALMTIVNIKSKIIIDFQKVPVRDIAFAYYGGFDNDINSGPHSFVNLGDTLAFWGRLRKAVPWLKNENHDIRSIDSIYVILFDNRGNLLKNDYPNRGNIQRSSLDSVNSRDVLCRSNGYPYYKATRKSAYSPYGILSFRNFPEIILDIEEWRDVRK